MGDSMGFLEHKKALVVGVANHYSLAAGIAHAMHREGAELAFTYFTDKLKSRVEKCAVDCESELVLPCNALKQDDVNAVFAALKKAWGGLDIIIHSIAFAPKDQLTGDYLDCVDEDGFTIAHLTSSYTLGVLAKAGLPLMEGRSGALLALTYEGARRVTPSYNVMGVAKASLEANVRYLASSLGSRKIRVNAVSAGPVKTLSAGGIAGFRKILDYDAKVNLLKRNVTSEEVGNTAAFLCSDLASGITGEIVHVDAGFHAVAVGDLN
jgi:enoyl-[acyl-carrier protein] reductase I